MAPPEINWTQECFRILGTGGIAYVAFLLANKGRKLDVLIKESYVSVKTLNVTVIELREYLDELRLDMSFIDFNQVSLKSLLVMISNQTYETQAKQLEEINKALKVNRRELILLSSTPRMIYEDIRKSARRLESDLIILSMILKKNLSVLPDVSQEVEKLSKEIGIAIESLNEKSEEFVNESYASLKLPRYQNLFQKRRTTSEIHTPSASDS